MSNMSRREGARVENDIAHAIQRHGIPARKRSGMYIRGHDLDVQVGGRTLRAEVKSRAQGFGTVYRWLEGRDVLIVKADRKSAHDIARHGVSWRHRLERRCQS